MNFAATRTKIPSTKCPSAINSDVVLICICVLAPAAATHAAAETASARVAAGTKSASSESSARPRLILRSTEAATALVLRATIRAATGIPGVMPRACGPVLDGSPALARCARSPRAQPIGPASTAAAAAPGGAVLAGTSMPDGSALPVPTVIVVVSDRDGRIRGRAQQLAKNQV